MNRSTTFNRSHVALVAKASHVILRRSSLAFLLSHFFFFFGEKSILPNKARAGIKKIKGCSL